MFCHKCGAQIDESAAFCHKCGTKVIHEDAKVPPPDAKVKNTANSNVSAINITRLIGPVLLVVIVVALIASGKLKNIRDKIGEIDQMIEAQATDSTVVNGWQSPSDLFPETSDSTPESSSESSFAWVEEPYMVTEGDVLQTRYIAGAIQNTSDITFTWASVEFVLYDAAGNQIGTTSDAISNFIAGNTWRFKAIVLSDEVAYFEFLHATKTYPKQPN